MDSETQEENPGPSTSQPPPEILDEASIPMPPGEPSHDVGGLVMEEPEEEGDDDDESSDDDDDGPPPAKTAKPNPLPKALQEEFGVQALPEHLSLDEVEEVKKRLKFGSAADRAFVAPISNPSGKVDLRGRPIPGMATMPEDKKPLPPGSEPQPSTSSSGGGEEGAPPADRVRGRWEMPEYYAPGALDPPPPAPPVAAAAAATKQKQAEKKKLYVSGMPPSIEEDSLVKHFAYFGTVTHCAVIRNRDTGISRGFAFVTMASEHEAESAVSLDKHVVDGREIRVAISQDQTAHQSAKSAKQAKANRSRLLESMVLPEQSRIYVGPLDDDVIGSDLTTQFSQFGSVCGVSRLRASETTCKRGYGFIEYKEGARAVCRAFGAKVFVKGKIVEIALSRMAMELYLTPTSVFFYDAFVHVDEAYLERHFKKFGQVFRTTHLLHRIPEASEARRMGYEAPTVPNKCYGFVDFVSKQATNACLEEKTQLLHPGQYVKLAKQLPLALMLDFLAIGDQHGIQIKKKLEKVTVTEGSWGNNIKVKGDGVITNQVRVPRTLVSRLIGERGRTVLNIARDSKTKINIPRVDNGQDTSVLVSITGKREDIRTAQYIMQKILKGQR